MRLIGRLLLNVAIAVMGSQAWAFCFDEAAAKYNLNADLLRGIAKVESGMRAGAMNMEHQKRTGSYDIGLMQINSGWLPVLAKEGITREALIGDACVNVKVGARILAKTMEKEGRDWNGVGAYNAVCSQLKGKACEKARMNYASKVWRAMQTSPLVLPVPLAPVLPAPSQIASIDIAEPTTIALNQGDKPNNQDD
jgi:soluble lytic murein transglycosylase-like protein